MEEENEEREPSMKELMKMVQQSVAAANKAAAAADKSVKTAQEIAITAANTAAEAVGARIRDELIQRYDPQIEELKRRIRQGASFGSSNGKPAVRGCHSSDDGWADRMAASRFPWV